MMNTLDDLCRPLADLEVELSRARANEPVVAAIDAVWTRGGLVSPSGDIVATRHSIGRRDGTILWGLARAVAPAASIETGFAFGISTACVLAAVPTVAHTSIDPLFRNWAGTLGLDYWRELGLAFDLIEEPSEYALPRLAVASRRIQFAFVDGVHTFDGALIDFFYLDRMLDRGGVIVIHDADAPAIETLVAFIVANRRYVVSTAYAPTIVVCQKLDEDDRRWDHFVPFTVAARAGWDRRR
jgi:predicted O-methyltransferase YrrM